MNVVWYQPEKSKTAHKVIHYCDDGGKFTLCGIEINENWYLIPARQIVASCKKCLKKSYYGRTKAN